MSTYIVQPGDTLPSMARRFLGDSGRWREIQLYNQHLLVDPSKLAPGMVLRLPPGAAAPAQSGGRQAGGSRRHRDRDGGGQPERAVARSPKRRAFSRR